MNFGFEWNESLVTPLNHRRLMNRLNRAQGQQHKDITLPGHFEESASNKYHYRRRASKYLRKKLRKYGETRPLVYTGLLREYLLEKSKVTATYDHWRIYCKAPRPLRDWMRAEIEKINKNEAKFYGKETGRAYAILVRTAQYARKRRAKVTP
jgi:hypothetical protein